MVSDSCPYAKEWNQNDVKFRKVNAGRRAAQDELLSKSGVNKNIIVMVEVCSENLYWADNSDLGSQVGHAAALKGLGPVDLWHSEAR